MRDVVVGSVLLAPSGDFRVVREVHRYRDGDLRSVTLAIRRCSWTKRAYTILNYVDLIQRGFRLVPVKPRRLTKPEDKLFFKARHAATWKGSCALMSCCDAEALP